MNVFFAFFYIPDWYKIRVKKLCDRIVSDDPFSLRYVPDQYKTQQVFDETVDDFLPTLNFAPNCFVTSKMIKNLFTACMQMKICYTLMKILVMFYLIVMKCVFLI